MRATLGVLAACAALVAVPARAGERLAFGGRVFDGERMREDVLVVVTGDRITSLEPDRGSSDALRIDGSVLTPGLVDLDGLLGLLSSRGELPEALSPDLLLTDGLATDEFEDEAFRRSGVTTALLGGADASVLAGRSALVQPGAARPSVLVSAWGAAASLSAAARHLERAPTSLPEQARALAETLAERRWDGPTLIRVDDAASARLAAAIPGAILVGQPTRRDLPEIAAARAFVASGLGPATSTEALDALVSLAARALPVAFGSGGRTGGPSTLRAAAARAIERGLPRERALSMLTAEAARIGGLPGGRGTLAKGAVADLVLWSGDPVSLTSRPLRVWVAGREVYRAD